MDTIARRAADAPLIVSVSMVKNEQDIIESFVRHNLRFVDAMVIVDNRSTDRTRDILLALQREGLPVVIGDDPDQAYDQSGKMTRVTRSVIQAFAPDYLCLLDADEFFTAPSRPAFEATLRTIPPGGQGLVAWTHYVLPPVPNGADDPLLAIRHRLKRETVDWYKTILSPPGMDLERIVIQQGNHGVVHRDGGSPPAVLLDGLRLAHIPVRGVDQLTAKIIVGRMAYYALLPQAERLGLGGHWDLIYQRLLTDGALDRQAVVTIALNYCQDLGGLSWEEATVEDPLPCHHTLRHTPPVGSGVASAVITVARSWEQQLRQRPSFAAAIVTEIAGRAERRRQATSGAAQATAQAQGAGTAFQPSWHLEQLYGDLPPFRFLFEKHRPGSVLDIGCGLGVYPLFARSLGAERVLGVDDLPPTAALLDERSFQRHDLTKPLDLGAAFDLVMCLEVAEHLSPADEQTLLASIARHARDRILFSAADLHQAGQGHINCRPIGHWLARWEALGWVPDGVETLGFRTLASLSWLRRNAIVLVRRGSAAATAAAALDSGPRLVRHGQRPWRWWDQKAGMIEHPFVQTVPPAHGPLSPAAAEAIIRLQREEQQRHAAAAPLAPAPPPAPPSTAAPSSLAYRPGDPWHRIVANDAARRLVERLNVRAMAALEISGRRWSDWPFANYFQTRHPSYDVCSAVVSRGEGNGDGRFDLVLVEQVLEHTDRPHQALRNIHTMLKEGGHVLVIAALLPKLARDPKDHSRWTESGLRLLLAANGFPDDGILSGSWGNRACAVASLDGPQPFDPQRHPLANDPDLPLTVWALARKPAG